MIDAVTLQERVRTAIDLGESHFREFKSALQGPPDRKAPRSHKEIARDICSTLVAFANADGGELIVGVEDDGSITGVAQDPSDLLRCWVDGVHPQTPLENVRFTAVAVGGLRVLYFSILKSTSAVHLTSDGRCLQRRDLESVPIAAEQIQYARQEKRSREYDREYVDGADASALDAALVKALAEQISAGMSVEKCLQHLDLADFADGYLRIRRAALLLFAVDATRWHPRLQIRVMRVSGNEVKTGAAFNVTSDEYVDGNIISLISRAWDQLRPHLVQTRLTGTAKFESRVMYPELACREALVNAIAHRDYSQEGRAIEVYIFDDRMEIVSPGGLLSSLTIDDLKRLEGAHQSRNAFVARVLREIGYMREVGEGMRRIFDLMRSNELAEPDISSTSEKFTVSLYNKPLYRPEHVIWLEAFASHELSREEKAIIVLGYGARPIAPNDIFNELGLVDTDHYRRLVERLQERGLLISIRSQSEAQIVAKETRKNKRDIPRYVVAHPDHITPKGRTSRSGEHVENFDEEGRIFLSNLPLDTEPDELRSLLAHVGVAADIIWFRRRKSYCFLQLDDPKQIAKALTVLTGEFLGDRPLVARRAFAKQL
jgi:ATP-dependent DNA helicase RecG